MPLPPQPPDLPERLHTIWHDTITQLQQAGTDRVDPHTLTAYCSAVDSHHRATELVTAAGPLIQRDGTVIANPAIAVQRDTANVIRNLGRAMGLTRINPPAMPMPDALPMRDHVGRWCTEHGRWECTGHRSRGRGDCHGIATATGTCRMHPGAGAQVKRAAAQLVRRVPTLGAGELRDVSPGQALLEEVSRTAREVEWLAQQVGELDPGAVVWGRDRERVSTAGEWPGTEVLSTAKPHVLVQLYHQQRRHLAQVTAAALAANVDERMVRVVEAEGAAIVAVLQSIFGDPELALTAAQQAVLPRVVPRHLRALTG